MKNAQLTPTEAAILAGLLRRKSGIAIQQTLGLTTYDAMQASNSLRQKLGVKNNETVREAAKRLGLKVVR